MTHDDASMGPTTKRKRGGGGCKTFNNRTGILDQDFLKKFNLAVIIFYFSPMVILSLMNTCKKSVKRGGLSSRAKKKQKRVFFVNLIMKTRNDSQANKLIHTYVSVAISNMKIYITIIHRYLAANKKFFS